MRPRLSGLFRSGLFRGWAFASVLATAMLGPAAAVAGAERTPAPTSAPEAPPRWRAIARHAAAPWPAAQRRNGTFRDAIRGRRASRYGEAMLGFALIQTGIREADRGLQRAGIRAIDWAVRHDRAGISEGDRVFENLAVASAFVGCRAHLSRDRLFRRVRSRWAWWLRRVHRVYLGFFVGPRSPWWRHYFNKHLVEAVEFLEMLRTGLHAPNRGTVLGDRRRTEGLARHLVDVEIPRIVATESFPLGREGRGAILADPGHAHLSYLGLSLGFYGRAVDLLRTRASAAARTALATVANTSAALAGPDGDAFWAGRSSQQAWGPALTAYGAEVAANRVAAEASRPYRALAERMMWRLSHAYGFGAAPFRIIPALVADPAARAGLDPYAGETDYTGLALVAMNWTVDHFRDEPRGPLPADGAGTRRVLYSLGTLVTVRRGDVWLALKQQPGPGKCIGNANHRCPGAGTVFDLREDFGLLALKRRDPATGQFADLMPAHPLSERRDESAGPVLLDTRGRGLPVGIRTDLEGDAVVMRGEYRPPGGRWRVPGSWTFRALPTGAEMTFAAGDRTRFELSGFFRERPAAVRRGSALRMGDDRELMTIAPVGDGRVEVSAGYGSGSEPRLYRALATIRTAGAGTVRVTWSPSTPR